MYIDSKLLQYLLLVKWSRRALHGNLCRFLAQSLHICCDHKKRV